MKRRRSEQPSEDFQMAPMIDMVFLLLVFFMTVSTLARDERVELDLPESERSVIPEELGARGTLSLGFDEAGATILYQGSVPVTLSELRPQIEEMLARDPAAIIYVRAEKNMPFHEIRRVLRTCAEAGAYNVTYGTVQSF